MRFELVPFGNLVKTVSTRGHQLPKQKYCTSGKIPVIDQGEKLFCGWTDNAELTLSRPQGVIIFGDHTRVVKFFAGDFVVGADGTKLLEPASDSMPIKYLAYLTEFCAENIANLGYSRHFKELKGHECLIAPKSDQGLIAEILSDADAAIAKTEMLVEKASKKVLSLQQKLINSPLHAGKWDFVSFSDSLLQKKEKTTRPNAYPALTSSRQGIFLQDEYFTRQVTSQDNTGYLIVRKGDFTYRAMAEGDSRFVFNQLLEHDAGIVSPAYYVFGIKDSDPVFFRHLLNCSAFGYAIKKIVQGGTRKALKFNMLKELSIRLPSQETQIKIGRVLLAAEQERDLLQQQVNALKNQKRGLMQKLLTGTWRVNHV